MLIRINSGGEDYTDVKGDVWLADDFFINGKTFSRVDAIANTQDDSLYQTGRWAKDLKYAIPVDNGDYAVKVKFAETEDKEDVNRIFDIDAEGQTAVNNFNIYEAAQGRNVAVDRSFNVSVSDRELNLDFIANTNNAKVAAIEIASTSSTETVSNNLERVSSNQSAPSGTSETIRINAGGEAYKDTNDSFWQADKFFINGNTTSTIAGINQTEDDTLYQTARYDSNLQYQIPVENGNYKVNLHFAETEQNDFNKRVFDVAIEGETIIDDLDIFETRKNAFTDGQNSALVISTPQINVNDGILNLDAVASIDNSQISAIEVVPVTGAQILIQQTDGNTSVTEKGDRNYYSLVLNEPPTSAVTVEIDSDSQLNLNRGVLIFTPENWNIPQSVGVKGANDNMQTGTQTAKIKHEVSSYDRDYDDFSIADLTVGIVDDDSATLDFQQKTVAKIDNPTTAAWGPDGRLYVATYSGLIRAYTFDDSYNVVRTQDINTIKDKADSNNILGIAFDPHDNSDSPTIYVTRSNLFVGTDEYSSKVSTLDGADFSQVKDIVTGLPSSGFDHGINGLEFDNNGDLYIAVGGNTNVGDFDGVFGSQAPESPLTSSILKAEITKPGFKGNLTYEFAPGTNPPPDASPNDQTYGPITKLAPGSDVSVFAAGVRNPYDLVWTTWGEFYATDNGPNDIAGDELNLIRAGNWYGHRNPARALEDSRQAKGIYDPNIASNPQYTAPLESFKSSTDGIDEYRANTFDGKLRGSLIAQKYNGFLYNVELSESRDRVVSTQIYGEISDGLDVLSGVGGAIVGIDFTDDRVTVATPNDASVDNMVAYDIDRWRSRGGNRFAIGGKNFGNFEDTSVTIGDKEVKITSVSDRQISGILPQFDGNFKDLLDITVNSDGQSSIIEDAFLPL